jgi:uncharacterized protein (DUF2236 family)
MGSGYFTDSSPLRALVGHRLSGLSGPRALLLMAAHPVAFAGFFAHTGALADPYARLEQTGRVMDAVAFGTRAEADRLTRRVRAVHGPLPLHLRPLLELVNQVTVGLLPPPVRRMYGFSWDPLRSLALHGGAEYVKRVVVPILPGRIARLPQARAA